MSICNEINSYLSDYYSLDERPALEAQRVAWQGSRSLAGVKMLDGTPVFRNTICKYLSLLEAGAELTIGISDKIPYNVECVNKLKSWGIPVVDEATARQMKFDIIMDCAGVFSTVPVELGYVELTRSGAYYYQGAIKPVYLADSSLIKEIETMLGTGNGFIRGMNQLGFAEWLNTRVVIFGGGKVGRGVAFYLSRAGAKVTVVDRAETVVPDLVELMDMSDRLGIERVLTAADFAISATGIKGSLSAMVSADLWHRPGLFLANIGVEDEFGDAVPDKSRVINNNRPVNFILEEPTLLRYIDPTMALSNHGAGLLVNGKLNPGVNIPTKLDQDLLLKSVMSVGLLNEEMREGGLIL